MLQSASASRKRFATILAFICIPLSGFITDIYLPSFPAMAKDLGVSADKIQLTLTCFFMSYGISQMFVGSLLDSLGRHRPAVIALGVLVLSSLLIGITHSVALICFLRVVQGIATAFVIVGKRAFFVDLYEGEERKHYLSYLTIIWSLGPIVAPFLGGFLQQYLNWQANFYFLAGYAFIMFVMELCFSGETLVHKKPLELNKIRDNYAHMLSNSTFLLGIVILGLSYSVVMVFNIAGPFVIEKSFHFNSVVIGYCTLILGFSWMIGGIVNKRLLHLDFNRKLVIAGFTQLILTVMLLLTGFVMHQLWWFVLFAFMIHICSGFLFTNLFTHSMLVFPQNAGLASGLMGGMVYVVTSFSSYVLSQTGRMTTAPDMSLRYVIMSAILTCAVIAVVRMRVARTAVIA
ncbi:MFS transporter [Chitinophaga sp.]|uniref:MFS transporter n=1 Tax=Chitinophaga sp. TaxID=1869181 RepID=UPI0031CF0BF7